VAPTTLRLTAAVRSHGGALPLCSGDIALAGLQLDLRTVEPQIAAYRRMVRDLAFDICELAPTTYRGSCLSYLYGNSLLMTRAPKACVVPDRLEYGNRLSHSTLSVASFRSSS
jgi:hypothetical protein